MISTQKLTGELYQEIRPDAQPREAQALSNQHRLDNWRISRLTLSWYLSYLNQILVFYQDLSITPHLSLSLIDVSDSSQPQTQPSPPSLYGSVPGLTNGRGGHQSAGNNTGTPASNHLHASSTIQMAIIVKSQDSGLLHGRSEWDIF